MTFLVWTFFATIIDIFLFDFYLFAIFLKLSLIFLFFSLKINKCFKPENEKEIHFKIFTSIFNKDCIL